MRTALAKGRVNAATSFDGDATGVRGFTSGNRC